MIDVHLKWAISDEAGFTAKKMSNRIIKSIDTLFETWKPRDNFEIINTNIKNTKTQNHQLTY